MKNDVILYKNTNNIYEDITSIVNQANDVAYKTVNVLLVERNWLLGKRIAEEELKDNRKDNYGKEIINDLSKRLTKDFGRGFDRTNLYHYLQFYKLYPNFVDSVSRQSILSWTHYRILLQVFSKEACDWYEQEALKGSWPVRTLQRNVSYLIYFHLMSFISCISYIKLIIISLTTGRLILW